MAPEQEALYALHWNVPRSELSMAAQLEYDRLRPAWERGEARSAGELEAARLAWKQEHPPADERRASLLVTGPDLETGKNLDNSTQQPLTGWKLWWRLSLRAEDGIAMLGSYKDSAFPACPACGSPNVVLTTSRKGQSYLCLERDCKSKGSCEVEGSNGVERHKAKVRTYVFLAALLVFLLILFLAGHSPNS